MHSKTLDILRAVAIFLVIGRHLQVCPPEVNSILHTITTIWRRGGWIGVDLFFVLSGFLVSGLLFKEHRRYGAISVKNFLLRRGFKIYPAFYTMLAVTVCFRLATDKSVPLRGLLAEIFFVQNYSPGLCGHTWSLAVEEHFYLSLPLVLCFSLARRQAGRREDWAWLPWSFGLIALVCLSLRLYLTSTTTFSYLTHQYPTHLRFDALTFGVYISYYYHYRAEKLKTFVERYRYGLIALGVTLLLPPFFVPIEKSYWLPGLGLSLTYLGSGLVLAGCFYLEPPPLLAVKALAFIGSRSYSIYLWHVIVITWVGGSLRKFAGGGAGWYLYALGSFGGSLLIGSLLAYLVELPLLRVRDRYFPSRSQPATPLTQNALTPLQP